MSEYAFDSDSPQIDESPDRFTIKKNGKWGYMDGRGKVVIKPEYDHAEEFSEGLGLVSYKASRDRYQDKDESPPTHLGSFSDELLKDKRSGHKCGFIDASGNVIVKPQFDDADRFSEGLAMVRAGDGESGKYGYIDKNGNMVIEPKFPYTGFTKNDLNFSDGLALVRIDGKMGFINREGEVVIRTDFDQAWPFTEDLAMVRKGDMRSGMYGFIDIKGNVVIDLSFNMAMPFSEGYACVRKEDWGKSGWGFIDKSGTVIIKREYQRAESFHNGLARIWSGDLINAFLAILSRVPFEPQISGTWKFIDSAGNVRLKMRNGWVGNFHEGLAVRKLAGVCSYIDMSGEEVISTQFDIARPFSYGLAMVKIDDKWGYIDKKGKYVWEPSK